MEHSFDVEIAKKYGVNCAIILKNLYFWVKKNEANDKHFHDGRYWTYNSVKAFNELFSYLGGSQIKSALKKLEEEGLILVGNYSEDTRDRTKWYALTETAYCICENRQMEQEEIANDNNINNINTNTDINTDTLSGDKAEMEKQTEEDFLIIRNDLYPKARWGSKIEALSRYRAWVSKKGKCVDGRYIHLDRRQVYIAVQNYVEQQKERGTDEEYYKNFETLMGKQLLDYVEFDE